MRINLPKGWYLEFILDDMWVFGISLNKHQWYEELERLKEAIAKFVIVIGEVLLPSLNEFGQNVLLTEEQIK